MTRSRVLIGSDYGRTWTKITDFRRPNDDKGKPAPVGSLRCAWDPAHDVLYLGMPGKDVYRFRVSVAASSGGSLASACSSAASRSRAAELMQ